jgi:hypothetical protein
MHRYGARRCVDGGTIPNADVELCGNNIDKTPH